MAMRTVVKKTTSTINVNNIRKPSLSRGDA